MFYKKYDVAFLPINTRLITMSDRLAKPLRDSGISTCILKTAFQGKQLSGWNEDGIIKKLKTPVVLINELWFQKKSNFFKYTYRSIKSMKTLKKDWDPPFKLLVVFMDTYAEGEVLSNICRYKGVKTILFQEGFHARNQKYSKNLYGLASFMRAKLFSKYFSNVNDGMYADHVAVWSDYGMKEDLIEMGRKVNTIHVVGNPLPHVVKSAYLDDLPTIPTVLIIHQPLSPRYSSKEWETSMYVSLVTKLNDLGYRIIFKPHPRCISDGTLKDLQNRISKKVLNSQTVQYIDRNIIAENLISKCNALITPISVTAYSSLRMGIPTIFIRTPRISNDLLINMHEINEIYYLSKSADVVSTIDKIFKDKDLRKLLYKQGPKSARKLSGSSKFFDSLWSDCIKKLMKKIDS